MFFKTASGAHVGDVLMSLIHACELSGVDPFGYLTELQRHSEELCRNFQKCMPWNYRETLERTRASPDEPADIGHCAIRPGLPTTVNFSYRPGFPIDAAAASPQLHATRKKTHGLAEKMGDQDHT
jgi:hypothetical protein